MDTAAAGEITVVEEATVVVVWVGADVEEVAVVEIRGRDGITVSCFHDYESRLQSPLWLRREKGALRILEDHGQMAVVGAGRLVRHGLMSVLVPLTELLR